jgi:hypothetical protein
MNEQGVPSPIVANSSTRVPAVPLTLGQILDRTSQLMRAHWRLFFGIAGVPAAAVFLFLVAMMSVMLTFIGPQLAGKTALPPHFPPFFAAIIFIAEPLLLVIYALYLSAAFFAAAQADLGVGVTIRQAYSVALGRFGRYLWLMILCFLYVIVPIAVVGAAMGVGILLVHHATGTVHGPDFPLLLIPLLVLFYLCLMVYSIFIMLRFAVAYPASVEENLTAWAALGRSAQLTHGAKWRILLVILVVYAAAYAAQFVAMFILFVLAALGALVAMLAHVAVRSAAFYFLVGLGVVAYGLLVLVSVLVTYSALTTALALLYHDQRRRIDGQAPAPVHAG